MTVAEILKSVWEKLGFKNKRQFATALGLNGRTELIQRAINSDVLTNSKLEMLVVTKFPNVRKEYLRTGEGPITSEVVCQGCAEKDKRINHQELLINFLDKENNDLKQKNERLLFEIAKLKEEIIKLKARKAG